MTALLSTGSRVETLADLLDELGGVPLQRIRLVPSLGGACDKDVVDLYRREKRLFELVNGVLVEKAVGFRESALACVFIHVIRDYLKQHPLGTVTGEAGMMRLDTGLIRIPDVAFISWEKLPNRRLPDASVPALVPDLVVEVLSAGNTEGEMARKRREYFAAGVRTVWVVDPERRTVEAYTALDQSTIYDEEQILDGGDVLPSFALPLRELFAELDRQPD